MEKWGGTSLTPREGGRKGRKEGSLGGSFLDCHAIKESASRTSPSPQAKVSQSVQFSRPVSPVQLLSCVRLFATPWTAACQASLFITNSRSLLKLRPIEWVMPSNHLILCRPLLCHPLLLPPSIFPPQGIHITISLSSYRTTVPNKWRCQHSSLQIKGARALQETIGGQIEEVQAPCVP